MMTQSDIKLLQEKGISQQQVQQQLNAFKTGFPYLKIEAAASTDKGIMVLNEQDIQKYVACWENYLANDCTVVKFVPASGAASRMFKELFEFMDSDSEQQPASVKEFFAGIKKFAFYEQLNETCQKLYANTIDGLMQLQQHKLVVAALLKKEGLNYGSLPKGLLKFHLYPQEQRTPAMEHLAEGALYAANGNKNVNLHFTVSQEHRALFEQHLLSNQKQYEQLFNVNYNVGFSEQKASTDTIAADAQGNPFRNDDGSLLFRPGGHGALIQNLNDIDADVIFVKNIDNVVPDKLKQPTITYKKVIAGILVHVQQQIFAFSAELQNPEISEAKLAVIYQFCEKYLSLHADNYASLSTHEKAEFLKKKLNRPIRVCGMVKNEGEPGGGPFLVYNEDGSVSLQILESSQIEHKELMKAATHFNPVDLVCAIKKPNGEKYNLIDFVDPKTGFISQKSKNGRELQALELPGLWNGAMSDWNTIFVEVPAETFNPVKTVNDLLRAQHQ